MIINLLSIVLHDSLLLHQNVTSKLPEMHIIFENSNAANQNENLEQSIK